MMLPLVLAGATVGEMIYAGVLLKRTPPLRGASYLLVLAPAQVLVPVVVLWWHFSTQDPLEDGGGLGGMADIVGGFLCLGGPVGFVMLIGTLALRQQDAANPRSSRSAQPQTRFPVQPNPVPRPNPPDRPPLG